MRSDRDLEEDIVEAERSDRAWQRQLAAEAADLGETPVNRRVRAVLILIAGIVLLMLAIAQLQWIG